MEETLVVIMEDEIVHTVKQPECDDPTCICHELQAVPSYIERDLSAE